jgi:hypothetical protein
MRKFLASGPNDSTNRQPREDVGEVHHCKVMIRKTMLAKLANDAFRSPEASP